MVNQIKVANEAKQDIAINKADQILGRLSDQTIIAKTVKSIQEGRVNFQWNQADYYPNRYFINDGATKTSNTSESENFHHSSELKNIKLATFDISNPNMTKLDIFNASNGGIPGSTTFFTISYRESDSTSSPRTNLPGNSVYLKEDGIYLNLDLMREEINRATTYSDGRSSSRIQDISASFDFLWRVTEYY